MSNTSKQRACEDARALAYQAREAWSNRLTQVVSELYLEWQKSGKARKYGTDTEWLENDLRKAASDVDDIKDLKYRYDDLTAVVVKACQALD